MIKWNSDGANSVHNFGLGMEYSFPVPIELSGQEGLTEWKGEIGDGIQDFVGKLFARNVAFHEMKGNVLGKFLRLSFNHCYEE